MLSCAKSPMTDALRGKKIVVTRPLRQADHLCALIEQAGGVAIRLPALDILPVSDPNAVAATLSGLKKYDIAIFVSRNAVMCAMSLLDGQSDRLEGLRIIALGEGTAAALHASGLGAITPGGARSDSESVLALPLLQEAAVRDKRVMIIRGRGGRELLADTLRRRGAQVDYAEVYQRTRPGYEKSLLDHVWLSDKPDWIVVTSGEALRNLFAILGAEHRVIMQNTQLVVISTRLAGMARELGFINPPVVADTGDEAILQAIMRNTPGAK